jgi:peptidoglycan-associated lipoprotein
MRIRIIAQIASILTVAVVSICLASAYAQDAPAHESAGRPEIALDYTYLRSNAPPASCSCFNLFGGSATFAWPLKLDKGQFALVGDITAVHANGISSGGYSLTLSTYTAGARYLPYVGRSPLQPFGEVLAGMVHSNGSLVNGGTANVPNAFAAFATNLGGGVDIHTGSHMNLRLLEADYVLTTVDNGRNNIQNNLRLSGGVVIRF